MKIGVFVESNIDCGLMYQSYRDIPPIVKTFLDFIQKTVDYARNEGIPNDDIDTKLKKFKSDVKMTMVKPKQVTTDKELSEVIKSIKDTKDEVGKLLDELGKVRGKFRFGDNLISGIIVKPKIYRNTIEESELEAVNKYMVKASNSLDWIEKVILDLMNLCDQDLNLATVVKSVYYRECHETSDFMEEFDEYDDIDLTDPFDDVISD